MSSTTVSVKLLTGTSCAKYSSRSVGRRILRFIAPSSPQRITSISVQMLQCLSSDGTKLISFRPAAVWSRDSSVGVASRYELDGPGIESQWGEILRTRPDRL